MNEEKSDYKEKRPDNPSTPVYIGRVNNCYCYLKKNLEPDLSEMGDGNVDNGLQTFYPFRLSKSKLVLQHANELKYLDPGNNYCY